MTADDAPSLESADLARRLQAALGEGFVVERELGAGGFAVVFLVRELALKRPLAIKVVSPDLITSHTVLARFRREAETVAGLSHPNIVPLHFIGEKDGLLYLAMGFVDGGDLAGRMEQAPGQQLSIREARRAIREVASALAHAHKRGVVHRDIKPQNVLLDAESGRCLVTDFGIARSAESSQLTATGMMVGTPAYIAPEQVTGEPSDHRADLYALGVMAYEMLVGAQPFAAPTPAAVLMKRLGPPPEPVRTKRADVPEDLEEVVRRCLEPDPALRYQDANEIVEALEGTGTPVSQSMPVAARAASASAGGASSAKLPMASVVPVATSSTDLSRPAPASGMPRVLIGVAMVAVLGGLGVFALRGSKSDGGTSASAAARPAVDSGMVLINEGDYIIGTDTGNAKARPAHREHLAAFGIESREVSIASYQAFATATSAPVPWTGTAPTPATLPVTRVQWAEAVNYCRWKHPDGGDLPSEAQWEAAARGAKGRAYPWGDAFNLAAANTAASRRLAAAPVGSFPLGATPDGVLDLIGNVWEWTRSPMQAYPGGAAMPDSLRAYYVIRGGAYNTPEAIATPTFRGYNRPAAPREQLDVTGFRCVMPARAESGAPP